MCKEKDSVEQDVVRKIWKVFSISVEWNLEDHSKRFLQSRGT